MTGASETYVNVGGLVVAALFVVAVATFVVWYYRRTHAAGWFEREAAALGWTVEDPPSSREVIEGWEWVAWFERVTGPVTAVASASIHTGGLERAFLVRMGGMLSHTRALSIHRGAWIGVVGRLRLESSSRVLLLPYMGSLGKVWMQAASGRRPVMLGDDVLDRSWMAYADDEADARLVLLGNPQVRAALVALSPSARVFEGRVPEVAALPDARRLKHFHVVVEIHGGRFALLAGANAFVPGSGRLEHLSRVAEGFASMLGGEG